MFENPNIVVSAHGGLSNKLNVVFSSLQEARRQNKNLIVHWDPTHQACRGFFLEYFEPISGVSFVKEKGSLIFDYEGHNMYPSYDNHTECIYNELKPLPYILKEIQKKRNILGNYDAAHIRRTDHVSFAKATGTYTPDEEFIEFFNSSSKTMYLATDNKKTYTEFKKQYTYRIPLDYPTDIREGELRVTSLKDSIIDMFLCVYSDKFKGSGGSTFSHLITVLRKCRM